tara:strand:+ start:15067 stop:15615 length:549 start_codon:yes stop_codon:yes gene_type:complete
MEQTQAGVTTYTREQHMECLRLLDRIRDAWVRFLDADARSSAAVYWDLLSYLWAEGGSARKTEARRSMKSLKSAHTAGKYVKAAIHKGMLEERENPKDARSRLLVLAPQTKMRMDAFLDWAVDELRHSSDAICRMASSDLSVSSSDVGSCGSSVAPIGSAERPGDTACINDGIDAKTRSSSQ